uniref:acyltransferase family protein n=1 Tax=Flavobacterium sp. TaxID=239 RepID=UPI00404AB3AF
MKSSIELIRLLAVILITFTHTRNELSSGFTYVIFEEIPRFGTAILSIISGFLYVKVSNKEPNLFRKKIKSLAIPYLLANVSILLLVLICYYLFHYNPLNRLSYDFKLITEGVFALNSPPINPPTYFIRDIFVIFSVLALVTKRNLKTLYILIPIVLFGTLILRMDVAFLFTIGCLFGIYKEKVPKTFLISILVGLSILIYFLSPDFLKFPVAFLIFALLVDWQFKFFNTGRFSYLLHLYHSPIIVITYPLLKKVISDEIGLITSQILVAIFFVWILFLVTKKYSFLKVISGGR